MNHTVRTPSLILRPYAASDAGAVTAFVAANRRSLAPFLSPWALALRTIEDAGKFLRWEQAGFLTRKRMSFGIWRDGGLRGEVAFFKFDDAEACCEVGYYLDRRQTGQGIATEAVGAACDHIMTGYGLRTIFAVCARDNRASQAVAERNGFVKQRIEDDVVVLARRR